MLSSDVEYTWKKSQDDYRNFTDICKKSYALKCAQRFSVKKRTRLLREQATWSSQPLALVQVDAREQLQVADGQLSTSTFDVRRSNGLFLRPIKARK